jgi:hypothetical protein
VYIEPWWLAALAARDVTVISHKLYDAHNYQLTGIEACVGGRSARVRPPLRPPFPPPPCSYLDLYILTGKQLYLDAVMGAWAMHRDPVRGFIHVGGSIAINEAGVYEPGSYWLSGRYPSLHKRRDALREARGRAAGEPLALAAHEHEHDHSHALEHEHSHAHSHAHSQKNDWGNHPTGEFCGAVFWLKINQRLHRLDPDNETFVLEMEREVYNEGLTHQGKGGEGIRYFSNLDGVKEDATHIGTCCEGQGTRLYGSLNEYLFSTRGPSIYVDIYAPASITHGALRVTVDTAWPYGSAISVAVESSAPGTVIDLALRMPSWVSAPSVPVGLNGAPFSTGAPGSYLHISRAWGAADALTFELPMALAAHAYTGVSQLPPYTRYSYTYGPVLLAVTGARRSDALQTEYIPGVDGADPAAWLTPVAGAPMHFSIAGLAGALMQPAWEVDQGRNFSAVPALDK